MQLETNPVNNESEMNQLFQKNDLESIETNFLIGQFKIALESAVKEIEIFTTYENYYLDPRFAALMIICLQSLAQTEGKINSFITKYYGSWENVSYDVLHLSINIHISKQNFTEAEEVALIAIEMFEKQKYHKPTHQSQYSRLVDMLIFRIYIPNKKLAPALSFLKLHASFIENIQKYQEAIELEISKNAEKVKTHEQNRLSHSPDKSSSLGARESSSRESFQQNEKKSVSNRNPSMMDQLLKWYNYLIVQAKEKGFMSMALLFFTFVIIYLKRNAVFSLISNILPQSITPVETSNNLRAQRINRLTQ